MDWDEFGPKKKEYMWIELYAHSYYSQNIDYGKEDEIVEICSMNEGSKLN
jgi:hypothetical protein